VLCSPSVRRFLKKLAEKISSSVMIISHGEITTGAQVYSIGTLKIE
ncbi:MAG: hypothetical protein HQL08_13500, partial [Nitrospirae bacterium]|nr:hypothetical protein [Nitrospirota bacterium]